jgi:YidC/Oxa1 family membrane protein insertase
VQKQNPVTTLPAPVVVAPSDITKPDNQETKAVVKEIKIATAKTELVLSTLGGRLISYKLKDYRLTTEQESPPLDFFSAANKTYGAGMTVTGDINLTADKVFALASDTPLDKGGREIKLVWQNSRVKVTKVFTFGSMETPYGFRLHTEVANLQEQNANIVVAFGSTIQQIAPAPSGFMGFLKQQGHNPFYAEYSEADAVQSEHDLEKVVSHWPEGSTPQWTAISNRYFLHAWMPSVGSSYPLQQVFSNIGGPVGVTLIPVIAPLPAPVKGGVADRGCITQNGCTLTLTAGKSAAFDFSIYSGPRLDSELGKFSPVIKSAVDYGWFTIIARPILMYMLFIHQYVPNWGLVILILTFTIKLILHPVNKKAFTSMKAMQLLQPKLDEIKKRYPDDPQKQQQETMQLFKTHKVSPLGCLPMFLQMPVYIALYRVLWGAPEFYHAPFFWFYHDLSAPDPYFILPILLVIFFVLQQILTPSATADPMQKRMMMLMPVFFALFMFFLPVGLVLYILANTVVSVVQQFMMKRDLSFTDMIRGDWKAKTVA